jgi:hypothetical protein
MSNSEASRRFAAHAVAALHAPPSAIDALGFAPQTSVPARAEADFQL